MQHGYVLVIDGEPVRATASLIHTSEKVSILTGIEVAYELRSLGYGTKLLLMVLADADKEGVTLLLSIEPDGSPHSLTAGELYQWYSDYGFYEIAENTMQRLPQEQQ